jgi:hypothetical protein
LTAVRIVDRYTITEMPVPPGVAKEGTMQVPILDLTALVILKSGDLVGESEATIVLRSPEGKLTEFPNKWPLNFKGGEDGASLILRFAMPAAATPGLYWFDVMWKGDVLTSIPLRLIRESKDAPFDGHTVAMS